MAGDDAPVLEARGIRVRYAGQVALDEVGVRLFRGEVHSIMGENGAGKSTLIKALTGVVEPDSGEILLHGRPVSFAGPGDAARHGVTAVYQEIELLPNLTVAENIMLGAEPRRLGGIDWKKTRVQAADALARLGLRLDVASPLRRHPPAVQQLVAIARAVRAEPIVLVLDEPTSSLDQDEVAELFRVVRTLRKAGVAIVFISHFLEQVYEIADRITVLRNGRLVGEYLTTDLLRIELVEKMLGRTFSSLDQIAERAKEVGPGADAVPVLDARGVGRARGIAPFDLRIGEGEVIGFAGLLGSGRTEAARILSGIDRADTGSIDVAGRRTALTTPRRAIRRGIVYSSEDRKSEGIIGDLTVRENILLSVQADNGWFRRLSRVRQSELAESYIDALRIVPPDPEAKAGTLSGGNQQKVLLARWLALAPRLLILDEPTRGIDVGAKVDVQRLVVSFAENGMSVVFISGELDEVLRLSDRIVVLRDREIVAVLENADMSDEQLLALIAQGPQADD
jgi:simple sugar transport system ATP-binding protein